MEVIIGKDLLRELDSYLKSNNVKKVYIITDENLNSLYMDYLLKHVKAYDVFTYIIKPGEGSKSIETTLSIYDDLIGKNIDRGTIIMGFGGGVVGDIAGFVASTYMRGLKYIQIPTSLLAQVDSSIGGKVGIDYRGLKNIIGSFYFPEITLIQLDFLKTLPTREITCGLGEILKYGLIYDYNFFQYVSSNIDKIYDRNLEVLLPIVKRSVAIKEEIVGKDRYDKGIRRILNFGHTIGHSIEALYDFGKYNHGEAVILGILYESYIAKKKGLIEKAYFEEIYKVLNKLVPLIQFSQREVERLIPIMQKDKKNEDGKIAFVLPTGTGRVDLFYDVEEGIIMDSLKGEWIDY